MSLTTRCRRRAWKHTKRPNNLLLIPSLFGTTPCHSLDTSFRTKTRNTRVYVPCETPTLACSMHLRESNPLVHCLVQPQTLLLCRFMGPSPRRLLIMALPPFLIATNRFKTTACRRLVFRKESPRHSLSVTNIFRTIYCGRDIVGLYLGSTFAGRHYSLWRPDTKLHALKPTALDTPPCFYYPLRFEKRLFLQHKPTSHYSSYHFTSLRIHVPTVLDINTLFFFHAPSAAPCFTHSSLWPSNPLQFV